MTPTRIATLVVTLLLPAILLVAPVPAASATDEGPEAATGTDTGTDTGEVETDYARLLLVLDSSGSMAEPIAGGTKIKAAKESLRTVIGQLPEAADVGLRVFGATVFSRNQAGACTDTQLVVEPGTDNRQELTRAVAGYEPYGETPISQALVAAAKDLGSEGKRSIVLVSDGEATCAPDPCEVAAQITEGGIDLQVDVIGLDVSGPAREQLRCVAEAGGGTYYDAADSDALTGTLSRISERAVRPFTFPGTRIEGSDDPVDPTTLTTGDWVDTISPERAVEGDRYYRIERTVPGSTIHVSAVTLGESESWEGLEATLATEAGQRCDSRTSRRGTVDNQLIGVHLSAPTDPEAYEAEDCASDDLLLSVRRKGDGAVQETDALIKVYEESPVSSLADLPLDSELDGYVAPEVDGEASEVVAGASFDDAPEVTTGRYRSTIVPGETQVFRVPLEWGQVLRTRVLLPQMTDSVEQITGYNAPYASLDVFDPMHGELKTYNAEENGVAPLAFVDKPGSLGDDVGPVSYRMREGYDSYATLPGDYALSLSVEPEDDGQTYEVAYVLEVEVVGSPVAAPDYTHPELAPDAPGSGLRADLVAATREPTAAEETPAADDPDTEDPDTETSVPPTPEPAPGEDDVEQEQADPAAGSGADGTGSVLDAPIVRTAATVGGAGLAVLLAAALGLGLARRRR